MDDQRDDHVPKKDKRRAGIAFRLNQITDLFEVERDFHYREMLHKLQSTLYSLHIGENPEFREALQDISETRDENLMVLYLWEKYQLECVNKTFEQEVEAANQDYEDKIKLVREKLVARLELQKKRLNEDKALLDIANDNSLFLSSGHTVTTRSRDGTTSRSRAVTNGNDGDYSGGDKHDSPASPDKRNLRVRDVSVLDDLSGLSGNEGRAGSGLGSNRSSRRFLGANGNASGTDEIELSERGDVDGFLFGKDGENSFRQHTKSYHGVPSAKPEETNEDINELRAGVKHMIASMR